MSTCNPIKVYSLSAQTNATASGYPCFDGGIGLYDTQTRSQNVYDLTYNQDCDDPGCYHQDTITSYYNVTSKFQYSIDQYGTISATEILDNGSYGDSYDVIDTCIENFNGVSNSIIVNGITSSQSTVCYESTGCDSGTCANCADCGCSYAPFLDSLIPTSCTEASLPDQNDSGIEHVICYEGFDYDAPYIHNRTNRRSSLSSPFSINNLSNLTKQSADKKILIKSQNDAQADPETFPPPYCNNSANKDGCWEEVISSFVIPNNNISTAGATTTSTLLARFRVGATKDMLSQKYRSIGGRVFIYIQGGDQTTSPCCNCTCSADCDPPCFDGTILLQQEYTLTTSSQLFQPGLEPIPQIRFAGLGSLDFDSNNFQDYAGQTAHVCATIDLLKFINN